MRPKPRLIIGARRTELSANFAALVDAIRGEGTAERAEERREDRGKRFREWVTIFLIAATLIAVSWQVHEMIKVYEPLRNQAEAAIKSADAATKSADAATQQALNAERTLIQTQRAWVGPLNAAFAAEPMIGKPLEVAIEYRNTGHEPATNFIYYVTWLAVTPSEDATADFVSQLNSYVHTCRNSQWGGGGSMVFPTTAGFASGYNLTTKSNDDLVDDAVVQGSKTVFVQGCFRYKTLDIPKYTYFCYFYKAGVTKIHNLNICASQDAD
jgi:hypothetical protein